MTRFSWGWSAALAAVSAAWWGISILRGAPIARAAGPLVQITAPALGFKLREGRTTPVRIRVEPEARPLLKWTVRLTGPQSTDTELAAGTRGVYGQVGTVAADGLAPGERYTLVLEASDTDGAASRAEVTFLVPDLQYTLIPLEPGNFLRNFLDGLSVDASGSMISFAGSPAGRRDFEIYFLNSAAGTLKKVELPLATSEGQKLSPDGRRFFFRELLALDYYDLETGTLIVGPATQADFFNTDSTGRIVALQSQNDLDPSVGNPSHTVQYFLYDDSTKAARQLTNDPQAIIYSSNEDYCPATLGTTPTISSDGNTIAIVTGATLGLAQSDPALGCRIFTYDVAGATLRYLTGLPREMVLGTSTMSADAHWLSFPVIQMVSTGVRRSIAGLLDLRTGEFSAPWKALTKSQIYDGAISADGSTVVLSTPADLDPSVGNTDGNFDLFAYDLASGRVTQISDTTGAHLQGLCPGYRPQVSSDARVVLFSLYRFSADKCTIDRPQINEADGLALGRVRAVRKRAGNRRPVLQPLNPVRVEAGDTLDLRLSATDPDGDPIVFFAQTLGALDVPSGSIIEDHHDGTATFRWATKPEDAGIHVVRVAAFDEGGGETFDDVTVAVCSRIVADGDLQGVQSALFETEPPAACRDADLNHDGMITAADMVSAAVEHR
jgi:hypothetical protein